MQVENMKHPIQISNSQYQRWVRSKEQGKRKINSRKFRFQEPLSQCSVKLFPRHADGGRIKSGVFSDSGGSNWQDKVLALEVLEPRRGVQTFICFAGAPGQAVRISADPSLAYCNVTNIEN